LRIHQVDAGHGDGGQAEPAVAGRENRVWCYGAEAAEMACIVCECANSGGAMTSSTQHLVIALNRENETAAPEDLERELRAIDGVAVLGASGGRVQVTATAAALSEIRERWGSEVKVELSEAGEIPE
jgi:hypothetical protein